MIYQCVFFNRIEIFKLELTWIYNYMASLYIQMIIHVHIFYTFKKEKEVGLRYSGPIDNIMTRRIVVDDFSVTAHFILFMYFYCGVCF